MYRYRSHCAWLSIDTFKGVPSLYCRYIYVYFTMWLQRRELVQIVCGYTTYQFTIATGYIICTLSVTNIHLFSQILTSSYFSIRPHPLTCAPVEGWHSLTRSPLFGVQHRALATQYTTNQIWYVCLIRTHWFRRRSVAQIRRAQRNRTTKLYHIGSEVVNLSIPLLTRIDKFVSMFVYTISHKVWNIKICSEQMFPYTPSTPITNRIYCMHTHLIDKCY